MKPNIFREYDIRGLVGSEFIIEETSNLTKAIASYLMTKHTESKQFIVGRDGRAHSDLIHQHMIHALCSLGIDVIDVGVCPTPAVYFAVHTLKIPTALVITASHNPQEYNGIKIWGVWGEQIQKIKKLYDNRMFADEAKVSGSVTKYDIITPYIDYLVEKFAHLKGFSLGTIIDCGNGTAGTVLPELVKRMEWTRTKLLFAEVDGTFPNHEADPTVPENMTFVKDALEKSMDFELGLGLDGDCDRMNPMTKQGELVSGDKMPALFAQEVLTKHPGAAIVCDIKSSGSLVDLLKKWGATLCIAPSGHSLIKKAMAQNNALLAGELSCHFFFNDRYFGYDDGIYACLRTLELMYTSQKTLDELLSIIPKKISSPEIRIPCNSDAEKLTIVAAVTKHFKERKDLELITIDGIRAHMSYGWGLIRSSNTQPVISLRFESDTKNGMLQVKNDFYTLLKPHFDEKLLREKIEF